MKDTQYLVERNTKHKYATRGKKHPLYRRWERMKSRCYNSNVQDYKYYGGRGIKVCDEWVDNPKSFIEWGLDNGFKNGLTLDRIDVDKDYSPKNCRWASRKLQSRNKRNTFNWDTVREIRNAKLLLPELTQREIAEAYNSNINTIGDILRGKNWAEI